MPEVHLDFRVKRADLHFDKEAFHVQNLQTFCIIFEGEFHSPQRDNIPLFSVLQIQALQKGTEKY